jgi:tripartite-type tricarboxylate transporter receptor subunit TctC
MLNRRHLLGLAAAGALAKPSLALAQGAWPNRSIRLVAQFPAGGLIGTDVVAKAPADGYTLLVSHASVHVYAAATRATMPFDPIGDFTHMVQLVEAPNIILVRANSPLQTLDQLVTAARTRPIRFGSSGIGSAPHLLGAMLSAEARAPNLDHIPYAGSAPAMQDLLAGNIECMVDPITTNVQQMRDGSLRALAVSSPQRLAAFPNVPTFAELGYPKLTSAQWLGLSAPKGLPAPMVERLTALAPQILARPELMTRFTDIQTVPRNPPPTGAAFVQIMREEITAWTAVARQFNITVS